MFKYSKKLNIPYTEGLDEKTILKTAWAFIKKRYPHQTYKRHTINFELGIMHLGFNKGASGTVSIKQKTGFYEITISISNFMIPGFLILAYFFVAISVLAREAYSLKDFIAVSVLFAIPFIASWLLFLLSSWLRINAIKNDMESKLP